MSAHERRVWLYRSLFWWLAIDPDQPLGEGDMPSVVARAFTRERLIEKCHERMKPVRHSPDEVILRWKEPR